MATTRCTNGHQYNSDIFGDKCPFCLENSYKRIYHISESKRESIFTTPLKDNKWDEVSRVEFRFGESSIPPQYHRSYTISISATSKSISIDCYGKILLRKDYKCSFVEFQKLKERLSVLGISEHEEIESHGCTGGTTEYLKLYKGQHCVLNGYVYHCVGDWGTLDLPREVSEIICNAIPDGVEKLIESTITDY